MYQVSRNISLWHLFFSPVKSQRGGVFSLASSRYSLAIQAMLQLPKEQEPLRAAMILREDALQMGVRLPVKVQLQLLDESLKAGEILDQGGWRLFHCRHPPSWRLITRFELGWNSPARLWWNNRHASMVHSGSVPGKSVSIAVRGFQNLVSFRFLDPEDHQNWSSCVGSPQKT